MQATNRHHGHGFPKGAGIFLGLGLGGFFDGIILHQVLQWHHMASSAGYPPTNLENLRFNVLLDGLFHVLTYIFVAIGLLLFWGALMLAGGWWLLRAGEQETTHQAGVAVTPS